MGVSRNQLNASRDALLERVVAFFAAQPDVLGIFLSGSIAAGTADAYADIDLRVLATEVGFDRLLAGRLRWPGQWGEFLFNEWVQGVHCCVSHFRPFLKLDVFYYSPRTLQPSHWLTLPVRVLLDRSGAIADILQQSRDLPAPQRDAAEASRVLSKALATAHECVRRARRAELVVAQSMLEALRQYMIELDEYIREQPQWAASLGQRERRLSPALRSAMAESYVGFDARAVEAAAQALAGALSDQVRLLHGKFALGRSLSSDLGAVSLVRDGSIP